MKKLLNILLLIISLPLSLAALSDWVKSYGLQHSDWPDSQFLTGFAMDNAADARALERAKEVALNDLVQKINVRIRSEQIIKETGNKSHSQTDFGMIINASSDLDISGVEYLVERKGGNLYVLALKEFSEGAISGGGINVELWTQKGRNVDTQIFEEGEEFQLYLRVNQPAFLRITYILSTGECVLLEPLYYVGMNMVNRAVKYPEVFEVIPPLGVEQLVVTAFSNEPGKAMTETKRISGQEYDVYKGMAAVTELSRGLRKKQKNGRTLERVGEAMLSLTMVKKQ